VAKTRAYDADAEGLAEHAPNLLLRNMVTISRAGEMLPTGAGIALAQRWLTVGSENGCFDGPRTDDAFADFRSDAADFAAWANKNGLLEEFSRSECLTLLAWVYASASVQNTRARVLERLAQAKGRRMR
jgi:hypothetical protein